MTTKWVIVELSWYALLRVAWFSQDAGGKRASSEEEDAEGRSKKLRLDPSANGAAMEAEVVKTEEAVSELKVESSEAIVETVVKESVEEVKLDPGTVKAEGEGAPPDPAEFWAELQGLAPEAQVRMPLHVHHPATCGSFRAQAIRLSQWSKSCNEANPVICN